MTAMLGLPLLAEKDERIKDLTREITGLNESKNTVENFAHYFKTAEVKQIEAPATEKRKPFLSRLKFW